MLKVAHVKEVATLKLPQEVVAVVRDTVVVLDAEYGEDDYATSIFRLYELGNILIIVNLTKPK